MMAEAHAMCGGDDSDGDTLVHTLTTAELPSHSHSVTVYGGTTGKSATATGSSGMGGGIFSGVAANIRGWNASWEGLAPMPYDAPAPVDKAAVAAKAEATERKGKSLMQAIGAVQSQITSDGRPPRFTVVED